MPYRGDGGGTPVNRGQTSGESSHKEMVLMVRGSLDTQKRSVIIGIRERGWEGGVFGYSVEVTVCNRTSE